MPNANAEEREARELAEESREKTWRGESFVRHLFMGRFRLDLVDPFPVEAPSRPEFLRFYEALRRLLEEEVDPVVIDETGEYPPHVLDGLRRIGAFGMKIPTEYGGLGLTHPEYIRAMMLVGSYDANITAILSAHQSIGVPQPVKLFGTEAQKRRYLPRCAKGAISAFALTEPEVGSDPAKLTTTATLTPDGEHYVLEGRKLWCTNGTLAELLVVMARDSRSGKIDAFVVETERPGVIVEHRCHFMGLRALANGVIRLDSVVVPKENLIGKKGQGLKIALVTLNTGRLTLPAATAGAAKHCLEICRKWTKARVQWGVPIHRHEAIAHKLSEIACSTFAMESVAELVGDMADREAYDIRLEAAAAKEWNTVRAWQIIDETFQVRGGRGYETARSLEARGEAKVAIERDMRDARINLIFEGTSEIMHLFMAREAVDEHLAIAGPLIDPKLDLRAKIRALPRIIGFYARWIPSIVFGFAFYPRHAHRGSLAKHLRFAEGRTRKLARAIFRGMIAHRAALERKQAFLFRVVDIAMEVFVLTATICRAHALEAKGRPEATSALALADTFAEGARKRIGEHFRALFFTDDARRYALAQDIAAGRHLWLEAGAIPLPYTEEDLRPDAFLGQEPEEEPSGVARGLERGADEAYRDVPGSPL
jgi:alkylation response protein AidB-like acyl-CoA dehydrogenase